MLDLESIRKQFPALGATGPDDRPVVHADAPGGTQVHGSVIAAMTDYLERGNANAHGLFATSVVTDALCSDVRGRVADFLGADPDGIVFGANMTTLTFHLARAFERRLGAGDQIVCTRLDHDANVAPWRGVAERTGAEIRWVGLRDDGTLDVSALEGTVTQRTRLIAFPRASNALGTLVDPAPFAAAARAVGAVTFMDAVHAAPHVAMDQVSAGVDVLVCSPYKFFGPHAGILSADPAVLADLRPDKVRPSPDSGPDRWQTGTASFEAIAGTGAAADYLLGLGMDVVRRHELDLSGRFLDGLADLGHVTLWGPSAAEARTPTFAVTLDGHHPDEVAAALAQQGIYAWSGHYYAIEPMRALGLLDAGGAVRIGFVHYHGDSDVDRVLQALADLA